MKIEDAKIGNVINDGSHVMYIYNIEEPHEHEDAPRAKFIALYNDAGTDINARKITPTGLSGDWCAHIKNGWYWRDTALIYKYEEGYN